MKIEVKRTVNVLGPSLGRKLLVCKNPVKAHEAIGLAVVSLTKRAFTQAGLRPATWSPLKPATIKAKRSKGYGTKPLISSGTLAHSPRVISATARNVEVGSDRLAGTHSLAAIHQLGSQDGSIPARPTWPFDSTGRLTDRGQKLVVGAAKAALRLDGK